MKNKVMVSMFTLASVSILLTACGQKTEKQSSSSSSTVEQSAKTSESKASKSKTATKSEMKDSATKASSETAATPTEKMPSASASQEKTEEASSVPTSSESTIDVNALLNGDYSSIAGTWKNAEGNIVTFDASGPVSSSFAGDKKVKREDMKGINVIDGVYVGSYGLLFDDGEAHTSVAWAVNVVPAGVASSYFKVVRDQDAIYMGQGADMDNDPYYRMN
ncbi:DUF6287 domain-containing protein [Streptococcus himalayensis]|uniref:DUF6287 domain-containing protein n=1 Tax=Streptococcus himalayensis TaxID=1888195 RepID=A0A917EG61_9STRE|nr:DUF6287 domain-containing protein [Streptococcus himalayensis]GGE37203.1 hypothetical protein GCM10011510_18160 [Streptococcus himalayensis]